MLSLGPLTILRWAVLFPIMEFGAVRRRRRRTHSIADPSFSVDATRGTSAFTPAPRPAAHTHQTIKETHMTDWIGSGFGFSTRLKFTLVEAAPKLSTSARFRDEDFLNQYPDVGHGPPRPFLKGRILMRSDEDLPVSKRPAKFGSDLQGTSGGKDVFCEKRRARHHTFLWNYLGKT